MNSRKKIILWIILISGLIIILSLIYYGRSLRLPREAGEAPPIIKETSQLLSNPLGAEIPKEVFYYTGVIGKKSSDSLILVALAQDNFLTADQEFIVRVGENTRFLKYKMPVYLRPGQSPKDFAADQGKTTFDDFKIGDRITVYADKNIKNASEFLASEIRAVEYK